MANTTKGPKDGSARESKRVPSLRDRQGKVALTATLMNGRGIGVGDQSASSTVDSSISRNIHIPTGKTTLLPVEVSALPVP